MPYFSVYEDKKNLAEAFCIELSENLPNGKPLINLVMALSSNTTVDNPVALSLSPVYHYQFSSINKTVGSLAADTDSYQDTLSNLQIIAYNHFEIDNEILLVTDKVPLYKPHSPTLKDRGYVYKPNNKVGGNQPIDVGYGYSFVNLLSSNDNWNVPFDICRVPPDQTDSQVACRQIKDLMFHPKLNLSDKAVTNLLDSHYGNASYLSPTYEYENLVNIVRFRSGSKIYPMTEAESKKTYGPKHFLIPESDQKTYHRKDRSYIVERQSIFEIPPDHSIEILQQTRKGRQIKIALSRWNDMLIRSKNGHSMKDKPLDLIAIKATDALTGLPVWKRDCMFVAITGKQKARVKTQEAYFKYRKRYAIEPSFRFNKQNLMMDKYQTPIVQNLDNWMLVVMITNLLLYIASSCVDYLPTKWRKYKPNENEPEPSGRFSPSKTRRAALSLFSTFDPTPFLPKTTKGGKGRKAGTIFQKRKHYKPIKKNKKMKNIKKSARKNE